MRRKNAKKNTDKYLKLEAKLDWEPHTSSPRGPCSMAHWDTRFQGFPDALFSPPFRVRFGLMVGGGLGFGVVFDFRTHLNRIR